MEKFRLYYADVTGTDGLVDIFHIFYADFFEKIYLSLYMNMVKCVK